MLARAITLAVLLSGATLARGTLAAQPSGASAAGSDTSTAKTEIDQLMHDTLRRWDVPGISISIVKDGQVVLSRGYGVRDPRSGAPMTGSTLVPTASLTKAFTAVALGTLVDEGALTFDGPVRAYLPGFTMPDAAATHEVTIRDLLSHRSGLSGRNDFVYYRVPGITSDELLRRLPFFAMSGRPRERYEYSNAAYVVLGEALERVAGIPYEQFVTDRLLKPLNMQRTTFSSNQAERDPDHAVGTWVWNGRPVYELLPFGPIINPHGGIISTADDMAKWMIMNLADGAFQGRRVIARSTLLETRRMQIPAQLDSGPQIFSIGYGMGWNTLVYRGEPTVLHTGGLPGFRTITILIPGQALGVTLMINSESPVFRDLAFQVADSFFGGEATDWLGRLTPPAAAGQAKPTPAGTRLATRAAPRSSHRLDEFVGVYKHPGYGTFRVRQDGSRLIGEYSGHSSPLVHRFHSVFEADPVTASSIVVSRVQFHDNVDGVVAAMTFGPFGDARFAKQPDERLSSSEYLRRLTGVYNMSGTLFTITAVGARLIYQRNDQDPVTLIPSLEGNYIHSRDNNLRISFVLGPKGPATALIRHEGGTATEARRQQ
jgi:CubicO group peptidase (beta-lactamase class C family)